MGLTKDDRELIDLLQKAVKVFYCCDAQSLLSDERQLDERCIAFRIGLYFNELVRSSRFSEYSVDSEYDKNGSSQKEVFMHCHDCATECEIKTELKYYNITNDRDKHMRPDLLLHKRNEFGNDIDEDNSNQNKLIVEVKTRHGQKEHKYDYAKLTYATCNEGRYNYQLGVFLYLTKDMAEFRLFKYGKQLSTQIVAYSNNSVN